MEDMGINSYLFYTRDKDDQDQRLADLVRKRKEREGTDLTNKTDIKSIYGVPGERTEQISSGDRIVQNQSLLGSMLIGRGSAKPNYGALLPKQQQEQMNKPVAAQPVKKHVPPPQASLIKTYYCDKCGRPANLRPSELKARGGIYRCASCAQKDRQAQLHGQEPQPQYKVTPIKPTRLAEMQVKAIEPERRNLNPAMVTNPASFLTGFSGNMLGRRKPGR